MPRLPKPGGDTGNWGQILNDYLRQAHTDTGSLKTNSVGSSQLQDNAVSADAIAPGAITTAALSQDIQDKIETITEQQGATGPTGATGPQGSQGATGVSGTPGVSGVQGATGSEGPTGATGSTGQPGESGEGVPAGGTTGQLLAKATSADFDSEWIDAPTVASSGVVSVLVATGSEARPAADMVLWIGGSSEPVNMANGDLWFSPNQPTDSEVPTAPTNLHSSNITSSSFTLSWTAATDNIAVTAYEVFLDGISYKIVTGTSTSITGRNGTTTYTCTVRARDAAGNWGSESEGLEVTTLTAVGGQHSVYGSSPIPALQAYNDGGTITVGSGFRVDASNYQVKGARLYIPSGATVPSSCTVYLFTVPGGGSAPDFTNPLRTATLAVVTGQWNEVDFPTIHTIVNGECFWIGYVFSDGTYLSSMAAGSDQVRASDGSPLYLISNDASGGQQRNYYRVNSEITRGSNVGGQSYGIDVIVAEA